MKIQKYFFRPYFTPMIFFLAFSQIAESVVFNNGSVNLVDYTINDIVDIWNSPSGNPTTVNLIEGGNITGSYCQINGKSGMNIANGLVKGYVLALDNTRFNMTSGTIEENLLGVGYSRLNVSGGFVGISGVGNLQVSDNSEIIFSGGQVGNNGGTGANDFETEQRSKATISGGILERLLTYDSSQVEVSGGTIGVPQWIGAANLSNESVVTVSGGRFLGNIYLGPNPYWTDETCMLIVEGSNFKVNGIPVNGYQDFININPTYTTYSLSGTLSSGEQIQNMIYLYDETVLRVAPIPEPATLLLLGLGVPILARMRRKR